jgi:hypothetical protein
MPRQKSSLVPAVKLSIQLALGILTIGTSGLIFFYYGSGRTSDTPTIIRGELKAPPHFSYHSSGEFKYPHMKFSIVGIDTQFQVESCFYKQLEVESSRKLEAGDFVTVSFFRIGNDYHSVVGITSETHGILLKVSDLSSCNSSHWVLRGTLLLVVFLAIQFLYGAVRNFLDRKSPVDFL